MNGREASMYMKPPNIMKRSVGDCRAMCMRPRIVLAILMVKAATGMIIIMLWTIDSVLSQPGIGPPIRWWPPTWP